MHPKHKPKPVTIDQHLRNWKRMIAYTKQATESEVWALLEYESKHKRRMSYALRIYGCASDLREKREKKAIALALSKS